ncbi:glycosyltransferase [Aphanizomenon flos-aquae]|uniref:Glycosyltransferase n=1 Tax=Aphanizomenon flos-aquae FACHB-1040 TaxID=2692887 RepID=A0ABR8C2R8_APHFL|nr:glycosyltransferase [Aphanizomenon flos-aquae]MBD2280326.1 glycosyltransferase [Aphanizomenon flos-aquae FACHB-1040]
MEFTEYQAANQPKIIVISSVSPQPTGAGQMLLYRHLSQANGWDVQIVPNPDDNQTYRWQTKLIKRLEHTRFHRWSHDLDILDNGNNWNAIIANYYQQPSNSIRENNTIVLTVAHGNGCWAAQRFAQKYQLPLVTIFHDWFPDLPSLHKPFHDLLEKRFQKLYQQSNLALCVSQGIKNALGSHSNSQVLYPIPALLNKEITQQPQTKNDEQISSRLKVVYFGNLYEYGPILAQLLEVTKNHPQIQVQVRGPRPNWPADFRSEMRDRQLWLDFAPREELNDWLASADVFLVVMSFDPALQRRMETSFPSKLPEYAQFGKPIVIWGPEYCSAIKWGREGDRALCVTDKNPSVLVSSLENFSQNLARREYYSCQARQAAAKDFNPITIQQQFLDEVSNLI